MALRHGLHPNQLYAWRRDLRSIGVADRDQVSCGFVPVAVLKSAGTAAAGSAVGTIEIAVAGMIVRVAPGIEPGFLSAVLRAVKAA